MNKVLLILILSISFSGATQFVNYFGGGQEWYQSSSCEQSSDDCFLNSEFIYYVAGDSDVVATGELYHVIRKVGTSTFENLDSSVSGFCEGSFTFDELAALLRQDGRKILMYDFTMEEEVLLYDFTLNEGDTLPITPIQPYENVIIEDIDSFAIGIHFLKKFYLNSESPADFIIEGIGSNFGFLEDMVEDTSCEYSHGCYSMMGELIWSLAGSELCASALDIDDPEQTVVKAFPNPVTDHLYLEGVKEGTKIVLFDQMGRKLRTSEYLPSGLDFSDLESGTYILLLEQVNSSAPIRIVKQ